MSQSSEVIDLIVNAPLISEFELEQPNYWKPRPGFNVEEQEKLTFYHSLEIFLKDSNAYTNTYFSRYFEWQGICREKWFHDCISSDMLQTLGVFITKSAHQDYIKETFPFQRVECQLNTFNIKQCSFYLLFRFSVAANTVSHGYQQIVFAGHDKKIKKLPNHILDRIKLYESDRKYIVQPAIALEIPD